MEGLIDVYENAGLFKVDPSRSVQVGTSEKLAENVPILFESLRFKGSPGTKNGESVIMEYAEFKALFDESTLGVLQKVDDWDNCMVAGGQVLACLRGLDPSIDKPSDIDIFMYGLEETEQWLARVHKLLSQIHEGYKIANQCNPDDRPSVFIDVVRTDHTLTLIPKYEVEIDDEWVSLPKVQIVTRKFDNAAAVLACFDVDCCCVAFDNTKVWASPRAVRALRTGVNLIDLKFRSATFENRLLKYSRRGFAVQDPEMRGHALACLDNYFGGDQGVKEKVDLENLVRCIRRSTGLLKLLLADLAGRRGVIWAGVIVDSASFDGENPEHGFEEEYGEEAFDPAQGPVVFHPPLLHEPWMAKYEHRQLEKLLAHWEDLSGELKVDFSRAGPEINSSREAWERGVYENSFENIEALLKLPPPQPVTSSAPANEPSPEQAESSKRPKPNPGAERPRANKGSPLLALPNLLLFDILNRCTGEALAAAAATCTTLERTIALGGVWKHACLRDFAPPGPATPLPDVPPQEWGQAYRELRSLAKMGWAEWDVNPMRAQAAWREKSAENGLEYAKNVPLPCDRHANAVFGDKLILTGGTRHKVGLAGTFVFDFRAKQWSKVPTKLRRRFLDGVTVKAVDWELPARRGHTMTPINGHEALILFGKRGLTPAELQRVRRASQRAGNAPNDLDAIQAGWARANEELDAIWGAEALHGLCADAYVLDVDTWTYEKLEARGIPPAPRKGHTAVAHPDGKSVVVFGGLLSSKERVVADADEQCISTAGLHVLAQECEKGRRVWVWREVETTGEAPHEQHGHGACVVGDRMIVLGGREGTGRNAGNRVKLWSLNLKSMHWSQPPVDQSESPPVLRLYCGGPVVVGDNVILVVGGVRVVYFNLRDSKWRYEDYNSELRVKSFDVERNVTHSRAPVARAGHTLARYGFSIYMVGGDVKSHNVFENMPVLDLLGYDVTPRA